MNDQLSIRTEERAPSDTDHPVTVYRHRSRYDVSDHKKFHGTGYAAACLDANGNVVDMEYTYATYHQYHHRQYYIRKWPGMKVILGMITNGLLCDDSFCNSRVHYFYAEGGDRKAFQVFMNNDRERRKKHGHNTR